MVGFGMQALLLLAGLAKNRMQLCRTSGSSASSGMPPVISFIIFVSSWQRPFGTWSLPLAAPQDHPRVFSSDPVRQRRHFKESARRGPSPALRPRDWSRGPYFSSSPRVPKAGYPERSQTKASMSSMNCGPCRKTESRPRSGLKAGKLNPNRPWLVEKASKKDMNASCLGRGSQISLNFCYIGCF